MASTQFHLHLISDSTGETVQAVARAVCAQFVNAEPQEHIYGLVRGKKALARVLEEMHENPGPVLYSILDEACAASCMRRAIKWQCRASRFCSPLLILWRRF